MDVSDKLKVILVVLLCSSPFIFVSVLVTQTNSKRVEAKVHRVVYIPTDTGNIIKLEIVTEFGGRGMVTLPTKSRLREGVKIVVVEHETVIGQRRYSFVRYVD